MKLTGWLLSSFVAPDVPVTIVQPSRATFVSSTSTLTTNTLSPAMSSGVTMWLAAANEPSKEDILLLRQAFAEFYGVDRNLEKSEQLLNDVIQRWKDQPADEKAGLYRVRGDCYSLLGDARRAVADYSEAITLLEGEGKAKADPSELPLALLGRARATLSLGKEMSVQDSKRSASDYRQALKLSSREDWDTEYELLEDGSLRNPYAAWEWGTALRSAGEWKEAGLAHALASNAFDEIGDKARSVVSLIDAGIDQAADGNDEEAKDLLAKAIPKTKGVESRDIALLRRVIAKEGEGRMALAAVLWAGGDKNEAEGLLGEACIRLDQLQADVFKKSNSNVPETPSSALKFSIDDFSTTDITCDRFKRENFLAETLGWPDLLQKKVIKLKTLR